MLSLAAVNFTQASTGPSEKWDKWLEEVRVIITPVEKSVFGSLKTEEDRQRFQKLFWKMRDPEPETPQNEYKIEFLSRRQHAEDRLGGANSDRGRIYILLGEPFEKTNYSGSSDLIDCELWVYHGQGRPGLPPYMHLVFFKPRNQGDYNLFHPGIHTALDIISPYYTARFQSKEQAYSFLRPDYPELTRATLSVIPGEGDPFFSATAQSSGYVFSQIFTLPEREFEQTYLQNFKSIEGAVDVAYSFRNISGDGCISITENRGFKFLNFSLMPDVIHTLKTGDNSHTARLSINLRIEDLEGNTIYQRERNMDLMLDVLKKKDIEEKKVIFADFAPIINGKYNVKITFSNKSTEEFFIYSDQIEVQNRDDGVMIGHKVEKTQSNDFMPFGVGHFRVMADPRFIFSKEASIEGIVISKDEPQIWITNLEDKTITIPIPDIEKRANAYVFKMPLREVKSGYYALNIEVDQREIFKKVITVLPFPIQTPLVFWQVEPASSDSNYTFITGQEYLNKGDVDSALENFHKMPKSLWNKQTLPVIARAHYLKKDYGKVIELLENTIVEESYSTLLLLANSSLEQKRLRKAAEYFEKLRAYGDTVKINRALGAIYYSLGEREKAKVYWERAKKIEEKIPDK